MNTLSKSVEMSNGARALARFTVPSERTLETPGLLPFRTLKRRERRAPHSAQSRYPFARDSIMQKVLLFAAAIATSALLGCSASRDIKPASPVSSGQVQANGITIAYESFGPTNRETVLLIMGLGGQLTVWPVELCEQLVKRGYRVIRYDN